MQMGLGVPLEGRVSRGPQVKGKLKGPFSQRIKTEDRYERREQNARSAERLEGFVLLWSEIKYNFAFFSRLPGLDWDKVLTEYLPLVREYQRLTLNWSSTLRPWTPGGMSRGSQLRNMP